MTITMFCNIIYILIIIIRMQVSAARTAVAENCAIREYLQNDSK